MLAQDSVLLPDVTQFHSLKLFQHKQIEQAVFKLNNRYPCLAIQQMEKNKHLIVAHVHQASNGWHQDRVLRQKGEGQEHILFEATSPERDVA